MRHLLLSLSLCIPAAWPGAAVATEMAWLLSVPHAQSSEHLYKVRIREIDGAPQRELIRYAVAPGRREVTVELMLDLEWEPDLLEGRRPPQLKRVVVDAEAGRTYLLGGRVDAEAPAESQLDQSYWEAVVFEQD